MGLVDQDGRPPSRHFVLVGLPKLWWNANFEARRRNPLVTSCSSDVQNWGEMRILKLAVATLSSFRARRTSKTEVKCEFWSSPSRPSRRFVLVGRPKLRWNANRPGSSGNPLVVSCSSDVQNWSEMQICDFDGSCWSDVRNCGKMVIFVCRVLPRASCAWFIHFCVRRCSKTWILKCGMARRCSETHILLLLDEPSRRIRWVDGTKLWRNANFLWEIVGSIARNVRFGSFVGNLKGSLARNVRFGSLFCEISRKPYEKKTLAKTEDLLHHLTLKQNSPHFTQKCNQKCTSSASLGKKCDQKCKPLKKVEAKVHAFEKSAKVRAFEKVEAKVQAFGKVQTKVQAFEKVQAKVQAIEKGGSKSASLQKVQAKVQAFQKSAGKSANLPKILQGTTFLVDYLDALVSVCSWHAWTTRAQSENLRCSWRQAQSEGDKGTIWELDILPASGPVPVTRPLGYNCNLGTWNFPGGRPSQKATGLHNYNLGTWNFPGGRPSQKATGLQLQSGNLKFSLAAGPVKSRQGYNYNLGTWNFPGGRPSQKATGLQLQSGNLKFSGRQAQSEGDRATTTIWQLEIFRAAGPVRRRQGYNYNLGTWNFPGGRPSQKATGLQLQSGNLKFSWRRAQSEGDRATTTIWELKIFPAAGPVTRQQGYAYNLGT